MWHGPCLLVFLLGNMGIDFNVARQQTGPCATGSKNDPKPGKNGNSGRPCFQRVVSLFSLCYLLLEKSSKSLILSVIARSCSIASLMGSLASSPGRLKLLTQPGHSRPASGEVTNAVNSTVTALSDEVTDATRSAVTASSGEITNAIGSTGIALSGEITNPVKSAAPGHLAGLQAVEQLV